MHFRKIDQSNYMDCILLEVDVNQRDYVAPNSQSLAEAAFEDGLYTLGVYSGDTMAGFILYDYDESIPGWSMSRFMIGRQFQGQGLGKKAVLHFLAYLKDKHSAEKVYVSVSLGNAAARKMYSGIGFEELREIEYHFGDRLFREMQMVKQL